MLPSVVLKFSPAGSAGLIDQLTTEPPAEVGVSFVLGTVALNEKLDAPYETCDGAMSSTVIVRLTVLWPPEFCAVTT
jgi:hypothetical protein